MYGSKRRSPLALACLALAVTVTARAETDNAQLVVVPLSHDGMVEQVTLRIYGMPRVLPFALYSAWGPTDHADTTNGWSHVTKLGDYPAGTTNVVYRIPDEILLERNDVRPDMRFFAFVDRATVLKAGARGYAARDALVADFDGIENGAGGDCGSRWVDRIGGAAIAFTGVTNKTGRSWYFKAGGVSCEGRLSAADTTNLFTRTAKRTVEIVQRSAADTSGIVFRTPPAFSLAFGVFSVGASCVASDADREFFDRGFGTSFNTFSLVHSVSGVRCTPTDLYRDGDRLLRTGANCWIGAIDGTVFGWRGVTDYGAYGYSGELFALRFYDRELTPAESLQNAFADRLRFLPGDEACTFASDVINVGIRSGRNLVVSTVTNAAGVATSARIRLGGVSVNGGDLFAAFGPTAGDADTTNGWAHVEKIRSVTAADYDLGTVPLPSGWGDGVQALRYFLYEKAELGAYEKAGLIANWDGIQWGDDLARWPDLVGGRAFALTNVTRSADGMGFYFAGGTTAGVGATARGWLDVADTAATFGKGVKTIEIRVAMRNSGTECVFKSSANNCFGHFGNDCSFDGGSTSRPMFAPGTLTECRTYVCVFSGNNRTFYANGKAQSRSADDYFGQTVTGTHLGWRGCSNSSKWNPLQGTVYALRLYTNELTQAQVVNNYQLDSARYEGTVNEAVSASNILTPSRAVEVVHAVRRPRTGKVLLSLRASEPATYPQKVYVAWGATDAGTEMSDWRQVVLVARGIDPACANITLTATNVGWCAAAPCLRAFLVDEKPNDATDDYAAQDALLAHWDGIDRGTDDAQWKDLRHGYVFAMSSAPVAPSGKGYAFDGSGSYGTLQNGADAWTFATNTVSDAKTLEIAARIDATDMRLLLMAKDGTGITFGLRDASRFCVSASTAAQIQYAYSQRRVHGFPHTYAVAYKSGAACEAHQDAVALSKAGGDFFSGAGTATCLGRRSQGHFFQGDIYSVRLYDRLLTRAELERNRAVDAARFFGADAPDGYRRVSVSPAVRFSYGTVLSVR